MSKKPRSSELHRGPGFRVRTHIERPDRGLVEALASFETADISDLMNRLYTMCSEIHNVVNDERIAGPACTVKVFPGDNLMVHKALDVVAPGDILVVDAGSTPMNGIIGDLIAQKARHRGVVGVVVDGLVRDIAGIRSVGLPVFARGVTPVGPLHRGPGEINHEVSCGGIVVLPGDIVIGDSDGVTVVRKTFAPELLTRLRSHRESMAEYIRDVRAGVFSNEWVDGILAEGDCEIEDGRGHAERGG